MLVLQFFTHNHPIVNKNNKSRMARLCECTCNISVLIWCIVVGLLFKRYMHGTDGRRAANELPILRNYLCHRRRGPNHYRPHGSAGEGARCFLYTHILCSQVISGHQMQLLPYSFMAKRNFIFYNIF